MDSVTHIAVGAVIGDAHLGRQTGYKAALWGAALCTIPDLDVLLYPFLDSAQELRFHRGFTHSILFMFAASPIMGWMIDRIHKKDGLGWKPWTLLSFWSFLSHMLIDVPTSYGTQIFEPFDSQPVTTDSIFIIDPLFTTLFIAGAIVALTQHRDSKLRYWASRGSLIAGSLYLIVNLGIKAHVNQVFDSSFDQQFGAYERKKTIPGPFTNMMWIGFVERSDSIYVSTYSVFDDDTYLHFKGIAKNSHLAAPYLDDYPMEVLLWFSMGYYKMEKKENNNGVYLHDLRFGRSDYWLTETGDYIWSNQLIFDEDSTEVIDFDRAIPLFDATVDSRRLIWNRFRGEKPGNSE